MGLHFKEDVQDKFSELDHVEQIGREEIHHGNGAVSVESKFRDANGEERYFFYNCMDGEFIPETIAEALGKHEWFNQHIQGSC